MNRNTFVILFAVAVVSIFVAADKAKKAKTLEERVGDMEKRMEILEKTMYATASLSVMDAQRSFERAKLTLRESEKLHNRGFITANQLSLDRFEFQRAKRELELAKSPTGGHRIALEIQIMDAQNTLEKKTTIS